MDTDPWRWTVDQVATFFHQHAARFISDMPHCRLPDPPLSDELLSANKVTGVVLLTHVDSSFLRDDCNIKALGDRSSVLHCIEKLRRKSAAYAQWSSGTSATLAPQPGTSDDRHYPDGNGDHVGQNVRAGEVQVQDVHGRKRRKLDLCGTHTVTQNTPPDKPTTNTLYLGDASLPVDELFFGKIALGQVIDNLEPDGDVFMTSDNEEIFQFQKQGKALGEAQYVHRQMLYFFQHENTIEIERRSRRALALLPYRETLASRHQPRSALTFQIWENEQVVAVRENAAFIHSTVDYNGLNQVSTSTEWDFLIEKYRDGSEVLAELDSQADQEITSSLADEIEKEENERAQEATGVLDRSKAIQVLEEEVRSMVDAFREKLPKLEERKAWGVWRKMKRSKSLKTALIEQADLRITRLNERLQKFHHNFLLDQWGSEEELRKTCEVMQPSIDDREELLWKKSVWQRKREPPRPNPQRKTGAEMTANQTTLAGGERRFVLYRGDRLITSTRAEGGLSPVHENQELASAAPATPVAPLDETGEAFDASGEDSDGSDEGALSADPNATATATVVTTPLPLETSKCEAGLTHVGPMSHSDADSDSADVRPSESDSLPEVSELLSTRQTPKTPAKSPVCLPVPLLTTSTSSKKKGAAPRYPLPVADPFDATASEVDRWNFDDLEVQQDRDRILIKLLKIEGRPYRDRLSTRLREWSRLEFPRRLELALKVLQGHANDDLKEHSETMLRCSRIFIAWLTSNALMIDAPTTSIPWDDVLRNNNQYDLFRDRIHKIVCYKGNSSMFVTPRKGKATRSSPVLISSDTESETPQPQTSTPHKKRKRKVQEDQAAAERRSKALERQEQYRSTMESQPLQQLHASAAESPSVSAIAINPTKTDQQEYIYLHEAIAQQMKPHQLEGIRFMWRELTATEDDDTGSQGCILAHTMGLGKTMQAIAVLTALDEAARSQDSRIRMQLPEQLRPEKIRDIRHLRILILCPPALSSNWKREIDHWARQALGQVFMLGSLTNNKAPSLSIVKDWHRAGGILVVGYDMFRKKVFGEQDGIHGTNSQIGQMILDGAEIAVADEAQEIKNQESKKSRAVARLRTRSRIALTGTPMSNDVQEIYALVSFVAPGYLGEPKEFRARFAEPIKEGTFAESTREEVRKSLKKLAVLHKNIEPKVNRANITVLRGSLKTKVEFVLTVPLMDQQLSVYKKYVNTVVGASSGGNQNLVRIFGWLAVLTLLTNHPLAFKRKLLTPTATKNESTPEPCSGSESEVNKPADPGPLAVVVHDSGEIEAAGDQHISNLGITEKMAKDLTEEISDDLNPKLSAKVSIFVQILEASERCGDKILVFTHSILTLNFLSDLLKSLKTPFGRIDGSVEAAKRLPIVDDFNKDKYNVLLISTRAGATGLNMQAANRVIIFDFSFNPAHEEQAIGRAYRLGQSKPVFVYRFVAGGTFETAMYNKQLFKASLARRVVDKKNPIRHAERACDWLYEPKQIVQRDLAPWIGKDPEVLDPILARYGSESDDKIDILIRDVSTMETLQEDAKDAPLDEQERKEVDEEIEYGRSARGKRKRAEPGMASSQHTAAPPSSRVVSSPQIRSVPGPPPFMQSLPMPTTVPSSASDTRTHFQAPENPPTLSSRPWPLAQPQVIDLTGDSSASRAMLPSQHAHHSPSLAHVSPSMNSQIQSQPLTHRQPSARPPPPASHASLGSIGPAATPPSNQPFTPNQ